MPEFPTHIALWPCSRYYGFLFQDEQNARGVLFSWHSFHTTMWRVTPMQQVGLSGHGRFNHTTDSYFLKIEFYFLKIEFLYPTGRSCQYYNMKSIWLCRAHQDNMYTSRMTQKYLFLSELWVFPCRYIPLKSTITWF